MKKKSVTARSWRAFKGNSPDNRIVKIKTETSGWGALKTFVVAFLIALQIAVLIYLHLSFALAFRWVMIVSLVLTAITCVYILSSKKNGLSKAVWIIFVLLGFSFGYVIYWLSDERIFFYRAKKRYKKVFSKSERYLSDKKKIKFNSKAVEEDANYFYNAGKFNAHTDNKITYFSSGCSVFDDILEQLKQAEKFIFIEFFIISDGALLNRITDILIKKVAEGVDVRLIYDDMGSHKTLSGKSKRKLKKAGVKIKPFNRLVPLFAVIMNYRDHRKIISIDGKIAYTGGINLADEYVNEKRMHGYWKDNGVKVEGSAVDEFTLAFLRQWEFLGKSVENYGEFLNRYDSFKNGNVVIPYADGLDYELPIGKAVYENMIASAKERVYIMTPYFITDETVMNLIINKAMSGVDVRLILPDVPDKAFVYGVSRSNAEKLIDFGVKVYTMDNAFVHTKMVLTENAVVTGSVNMDLRSFYQQFECAIYSNDKEFMDSAMKDFTNTFNLSTEINDKNKRIKNPLYRAFAGLMQVFAPFM